MLSVSGLRVYISGPMTGIPRFNKQAFDACEKELKVRGARFVHNPAKEVPMSDSLAWPHADYMRESVYELASSRTEGRGMTRKRNFYDLLVMLPGWESSAGAKLEREVAEAIGIEVYEWKERTI